METLRSADGFSGLVVVLVIYFVLTLLSRAGRKPAGKGTRPPRPAPAEPSATQEEGLSLERILREIERVKQQREGTPARLPAPSQPPPPARRPLPPQTRRPPQPTERGPLGRRAATGLRDAEDVEDRESLEGTALGGESLGLSQEEARRRQRVVVDQDEQAQAIVQRRIQEAEARNRPLSEVDHKAFDRAIREEGGPAPSAPRYSAAQLRNAIVWREIMGVPKGLE